ncbi:MAG: aquaporin [Pseudomonadota bacterium]
MFDSRQLGAEFLGTFALVSAVCGAGLFSAPSAGLVAVAFAVGLSVLAMAFAVGSISGGHFNPAVTLGLVAAGRFEINRAPGYIIAQVLGGAVAAAIFWFILSGLPAGKWNTFTAISNIAGPNALVSSGLLEIVITGLFVFVIASVTGGNAPVAFAPIAIGLALVLFHLIAIPVTNASLNPARSTATALFGGPAAVQSLWLFWAAPIVGGVIGGMAARWLHNEYPRSASRRRRSRR